MDSSFRTPDAFGQQIAELRREIEGIQELNTLYRTRRSRGYGDQADYDRRRARLEEIVRQLAVLRGSYRERAPPVKPGEKSSLRN
jgi:hypothetical protein